MAEGAHELTGRRVRLEKGSVRLSDATLVRSALTIDRAVRNAMPFMGAPLQDAVRMASEAPAEILNIPRKGRIRPGADADLVVLSADCAVVETIVAGETVYYGKE